MDSLEALFEHDAALGFDAGGSGGDLVRLTPAGPVTCCFDPGAVAATSRIATRGRDTGGLAEATTALEATGLQSEFETGRRGLEEF